MRFVNKGERNGKGLYYASRKDDEENCALCTVAGAINLTMGRPTVSTRMVAQMSPQQGMTLGSTPDEQVKSILRLVEERTLRDGEYCGKRAYAEAAAWMAGFADGTVYAMWIEGFLRGNGKSCTHWLNALKAGNVVRYFDFQANRKVAHEHEQDSGGGLNPATALVPSVPLRRRASPASESTSPGRTFSARTSTVPSSPPTPSAASSPSRRAARPRGGTCAPSSDGRVGEPRPLPAPSPKPAPRSPDGVPPIAGR